MSFTIHIASWVWPFVAGLVIGFLVGSGWALSAMMPRNV